MTSIFNSAQVVLRHSYQSEIMSATKRDNEKFHVLIAGAGVVGLTIAQGCRQHNIPFTIFERDERQNSRSQGWALTLHWSLRSLRRTIGPELSEQLPSVSSPLSERFTSMIRFTVF